MKIDFSTHSLRNREHSVPVDLILMLILAFFILSVPEQIKFISRYLLSGDFREMVTLLTPALHFIIILFIFFFFFSQRKKLLSTIIASATVGKNLNEQVERLIDIYTQLRQSIQSNPEEMASKLYHAFDEFENFLINERPERQDKSIDWSKAPSPEHPDLSPLPQPDEIQMREKTGETLIKYQHQLEELTQIRTAEIINLNEQLIKEIQDGLTIIEDRRVVFLNDRACEIFGYPRSELMKLSAIDLVVPEEKERLIQMMKNMQIQGQTSCELEFWISQKDGTRRYIRNRFSALMKDNGIPTRYVITTDMTQRRQVEMALEASEARYRAISELTSDFAFSIKINADNSLSAEWITDAFQKITGYTFEESLEQIVFDKIILPEDLSSLQDEFKTLMSGKSIVIEYRIFNKNGQIQWIQNYLKPIWDNTENRITHLFGAARDITHRKNIELKLRNYHSRLKKLVRKRTTALNTSNQLLKQEVKDRKKIAVDLREAHARLNATLDALPDLMFEIDQEGRFYEFHSSNISILYTPPEVFIGQTIPDILPKEVCQVIFPAIQETLATGRHVGATYSLQTPLGERWFELSMVQKEVTVIGLKRLIVLARDITIRKQAEEALKIKDAAIESALNGLILTDLAGKIIYANPAFLKYWGYEKSEEVVGQSILNFWEDLNQAQMVYQSLLENGHWIGELSARRKDNSNFDVWIATSIIYNKDQRPIQLMASFIDITRQKLLQTQLIRSEQLAATGQLAASIAHEINSPLQAVTLLLNMLRQKFNHLPELIENITILETAYGNIRDTVRNLLDLNRPGRANYQLTDLNSIITNLAALLKRYLREYGIKLELNLSKEIPSITVSPLQIGQVILNLIRNDVEAMTGHEEITSLNMNRITDNSIIIETLPANQKIILNIRDNGTGIPSEDLQHIFDPFYTRKKSMGVGIGLSICAGIIREHKGTIEAFSLNPGALFQIKLPVN